MPGDDDSAICEAKAKSQRHGRRDRADFDDKPAFRRILVAMDASDSALAAPLAWRWSFRTRSTAKLPSFMLPTRLIRGCPR